MSPLMGISLTENGPLTTVERASGHPVVLETLRPQRAAYWLRMSPVMLISCAENDSHSEVEEASFTEWMEFMQFTGKIGGCLHR